MFGVRYSESADQITGFEYRISINELRMLILKRMKKFDLEEGVEIARNKLS